MVTSTADLRALLSEVLEEGSGPAVLQAGHFALDLPDGVVSDRLSVDAGVLRSPFAMFADSTWRAACSLVSTLKQNNVDDVPTLMVLVNDWQFLRRKEEDRRRQESAASRARKAYYQSVNRLPRMHETALVEAGLTRSDVFKCNPERWLFSEHDLRVGLAATLRRLRLEGRSEELGIVETRTATGDPVIRIRSTMDAEVCLLYCGNTNCAGEVVELLRVLQDRGVRRFVNLFPLECLTPVEAGTAVANDLFDLTGLLIANIGLDRWTLASSGELIGEARIHAL